MIKASEVRAKMTGTFDINDIKNSAEFKYAMQKLEIEIINAANNGKCEIEFNINAKHGKWPSVDFLVAIVIELGANGYNVWNWQKYTPDPNWNIIIGW